MSGRHNPKLEIALILVIVVVVIGIVLLVRGVKPSALLQKIMTASVYSG
jgi:hypothetical protein